MGRGGPHYGPDCRHTSRCPRTPCAVPRRPSLSPSQTAPGGHRRPWRCPGHRLPAHQPPEAARFGLPPPARPGCEAGGWSPCPRAAFSILFEALRGTGVSRGDGVDDKHGLALPGGLEGCAGAHLREDGNSENEAQPVSLVGIGSSVLQTSDPTESKGAPCVVSMGTSKLADQLGAGKRGGISF